MWIDIFSKKKRKEDELWDQGIQSFQKGDTEKGVKLLAEAVNISEQNGLLQKTAERADTLAVLLTELGALQDALQFHKRSLALEKKIGNMRGVAISLTNIGILHLMMGNPTEDLACQQEALNLFQTIGDQNGEAMVLHNLGNIHSKTNDIALAITCYEHAVMLAEQLGIGNILLPALSSLGVIYSQEGDLKRANATLEKALNYLDTFSEPRTASIIPVEWRETDIELTLLENLAKICTKRRDFSKAIMYCNRLIEKQRNMGDRQGFAKAMTLLGSIHMEKGEMDHAIECTEKALQLLLEISDDEDFARCCFQLALIYHRIGDLSHSLSTYEKALRTAPFCLYPELHSMIEGNFGLLYLDLGMFTQALKYSEEALQHARLMNFRLIEAAQLGNLGLIYQQMKDFSRAFNYFRAALSIQQDIGDEFNQANQLGNIGLTALELDNPRAAIQYFSQALELSVRLGMQYQEGIFLGNIGIAYEKLEEYEQAMSYFEQAVTKSREAGNRQFEIINLANLGGVFRILQRQSDALKALNEAIALVNECNEPDLIYHLHYSRGILNKELGLINNAYLDLKTSIENLEFLRLHIAGEENKLRFASDLEKSVLFEHIIELLYDKLKRNGESYEYIRRAKSQVFADQISHLDPIQKPFVPNHLCQAEQQLVIKLRNMEKNLALMPWASEENSWAELKETRRELDSVVSEITKFSPEYTKSHLTNILSIDQIHTTLNSQDKNITFVEFFVMVDKVLMYVMRTYDQELHIHEVPIEMARLEHFFRRWQNEIAQYQSLSLKETWHTLSDELIRPLRQYLDGCELLCLVPHMHLQYFPIHALMMDSMRLIEHVPIVYLPTSRLLEYWSHHPERNSKGCIAFGYSQHAKEKALFEEEAISIAKYFGGNALVGDKATCTAVRNEAKQYAYLHFSCHGFFDEKAALNSGIDLADGRLTVKDIMGLTLDANLIVLSACMSGVNMHTYSDDLVGLTRSFLIAGANSILVSLWAVDGESTFQFMEAFYGYLKSGHTKVMALQKAQLDLMRQPQFAHPYYWAPFILIGNWR